MEVKIGVQHAPRELVLESAQTPDEVEQAVAKAIEGSVLQLVDDKGRRIIVPSDKIGYVEIGEHSHRPLGFAPPS